MKDNSGQALIEFAVFFLALIPMLVCLVGFSKWFVIREKILIAVRDGALLYSSGRMKDSEVRERLTQFLTTGNPSLVQNRLRIDIGCYNKFSTPSALYQLDIVRIRYTSQSHWYQTLNLNPQLEEKCIIKHAATYGPGLQPIYGPAVQWMFGSNVSD